MDLLNSIARNFSVFKTNKFREFRFVFLIKQIKLTKKFQVFRATDTILE